MPVAWSTASLPVSSYRQNRNNLPALLCRESPRSDVTEPVLSGASIRTYPREILRNDPAQPVALRKVPRRVPGDPLPVIPFQAPAPVPDDLPGHLQVELQPEAGADREPLVLHPAARAEEPPPVREPKRLAMELEGREFLREAGEDARAVRDLLQSVPAGLGDKAVHRRPERGRDELGAEADAEHPLPLLHGSPDELLLLPEVREFPFIVHAHRAAQEDKVGGIRAGHCTGFAEPDVFEGDIVFSEDLFKVPGRLRAFVLEDRDLHGSCTDPGVPSR